MLTRLLYVLLGLSIAVPAMAVEVAGVQIAEHVGGADGRQALTLNGAGIRSKFFVKVYVGALYLPEKTNDVATILAMPGAKRVSMHVLYDEISKQKLTGGWTDGFRDNHEQAVFDALKPRVRTFNALFDTVKKGDVILMDFSAGGATHVTINGNNKGSVGGADFQRALLKVWLGEEPADADLKEAMLGGG